MEMPNFSIFDSNAHSNQENRHKNTQFA
ncbi:MAG: hypothetical protein ACI814_004584, partial [Mariniblastus sp.]